MCGIAGALNLSFNKLPNLQKRLQTMNQILAHRGPDGSGTWVDEDEFVGLAHTRLSIIDLSGGSQPMKTESGDIISFNGEIYNYIELREQLGPEIFRTNSDTEVILRAYQKWGKDCVKHFRGMFAFAIWDRGRKRLFCARDFFGIKPFYYTMANNTFYFASEIKALLPFVDEVETDIQAFAEYLKFQFVLNEKTLFKDIKQLEPAHHLTVSENSISVNKYWEVIYQMDHNHTEKYFKSELTRLLKESVALHTRSDVEIGGFLSGGLDSSTICSLVSENQSDFMAFTGKFLEGSKYDETKYAKIVADTKDFELSTLEISSHDFVDNIRNVIYHLDMPAVGPGSFSQYMISSHASKFRKVVLGGQGGDEIFGGYTRYLIAYFEQCIKGAIEGKLDSGNFIVTYESIIPNLTALNSYKPMLKQFWSQGLFEDMDKRYFTLIDRSPLLTSEINWELLGDYSPYDTFRNIFYGKNVQKKSYFDLMTNFDFKTFLPALLHIEDRVSMAHGLESRVPLLDRPYVEFSATIPSNIKFENGNMKYIFKKSIENIIPDQILNRKDKMGFPTPFSKWAKSETRDFIVDTLSTTQARSRSLINNTEVLDKMGNEQEFGRKLWGFLCLELWQQEFHDKHQKFKEKIY